MFVFCQASDPVLAVEARENPAESGNHHGSAGRLCGDRSHLAGRRRTFFPAGFHHAADLFLGRELHGMPFRSDFAEQGFGFWRPSAPCCRRHEIGGNADRAGTSLPVVSPVGGRFPNVRLHVRRMHVPRGTPAECLVSQKKENTEEMKTLKQTVQTDLFSIQKDFAEIINKRLSSPMD